MSARGSDEERSEEEEEERARWVTKRVCQLLGYPPNTRTPTLVWPLHPHHPSPPALLDRFLDEADSGSCLFFWQDQELPDDLDGVEGHHHHHLPTTTTASTTFSWKFDEAAGDSDDDNAANNGCVVQSFTEVGAAGPMLLVAEGPAPRLVGAAGVLLKKAVTGTLPDGDQAHDLLPQCLHLTYLHPNTHRALHAIFQQVCRPICERLGKADRTAYLASLASHFSRLCDLTTPDPALDYDSDEDEDPQKQAVACLGALKEPGEEMDDQRREQGESKGGEGNEEVQVKDPKTLLVKNVRRHYDKHSQVNSDVTLEELQTSWTCSFLELSATLAHLHSHPLMMGEEGKEEEEKAEEVMEEENGGGRELEEAVLELSDLHSDLSDCHKSLAYLHKFIKVVSERRLESLAGHAWDLLDLLLLVWRLGRRHGISGKVQLILESAVESLVELVTHELRPVNLLPSSMREPQPFLDSAGRVKEALQVVGEWEAAVERCAHSVSRSAKRQRDGRQDFDPKKVLPTIGSLRAVCVDLSDIMKVLLEAQTGFSGEWSALIRVQDPDQLKSVTSQVLRVLTAYDFNIFSTRNQDRWVRQKEDFQLAVQKWEQAVVSAITESFRDRM
ncbi:uncharacterized protein [Procambarus clarkii]|uniref:uncharacterized protein n=1 Tax=Procambarus clarkii TaxID=6728 RepID=UPI00374413EA